MLTNKRILITGGTGSWGQELVKQILKRYNPKEIIIYSRGEHKQVEMRYNFNDPRLRFVIGDIRDKERLSCYTQGIDVIFNLAALKHVPICESHPREAILTNVIGAENVIECAIKSRVKEVVHVSTDKAVEPINLYGLTKACAEKLFIAANNTNGYTKFNCVRGGNVSGTQGSVIPLFKAQIRKNNEITLTSPNMTRFLMTLEEAIGLLLKSLEKADVGGEIRVMKMPAIKIMDLIQVMIKGLGDSQTKIRMIGVRPGEKLHESLVADYEKDRTIEESDHFIIIPQSRLDEFKLKYKNKKIGVTDRFTSNNTRFLSKEEIERLLEKDGWLDGKHEDDTIKNLTKDELKIFSNWRDDIKKHFK